MIAEAHEIRENQSYRNVNLTNIGAKQNINEEAVSLSMQLLELVFFISLAGGLRCCQ